MYISVSVLKQDIPIFTDLPDRRLFIIILHRETTESAMNYGSKMFTQFEPCLKHSFFRINKTILADFYRDIYFLFRVYP